MIQQQLMQQQMIQQQMMQQQMIQQQMMEQQMRQQQIDNWEIVNIVFRGGRGGGKNIVIETDTTLKELFDKYMNEKFGYENSKIKFFVNVVEIKRNDNTKIKDYFSNYSGLPVLPEIIAIE